MIFKNSLYRYFTIRYATKVYNYIKLRKYLGKY